MYKEIFCYFFKHICIVKLKDTKMNFYKISCPATFSLKHIPGGCSYVEHLITIVEAEETGGFQVVQKNTSHHTF